MLGLKNSLAGRFLLYGGALVCIAAFMVTPLHSQGDGTSVAKSANDSGGEVASLREELIITFVDKGLLALVVLAAGFWANKALEKVRATYALQSEMEKLRDARQLDFMERQLSEFYWPIYVRLEYDTAVWERILDKKQTGDVAGQKIGAAIEENFILPNHEETVEIIRSKIHLMKDDPETFQAMLSFISFTLSDSRTS